MKLTTAAFLVLIVCLTGKAETFIGVTSTTNRLVVGTNEALVINRFEVTGSGEFQLIKDGITFTATSGGNGGVVLIDRLSANSPGAIAGPCELLFANPALLSFQRIATSSIQMIVLTPSVNTNSATVSIPPNRSIRIFRPITSYYSGLLRASRGTNSVDLPIFGFRASEEFTGPLDLTFFGPTSGTISTIISYATVEDAQLVPQNVAVQSPTGIFQLELERSTNLTNWVPVVIQSLREDQKAFYRFRITK